MLHYVIYILSCCCLIYCSPIKLNQKSKIPIFEISSASLWDAGLQQGQLAGDRIRKWLASPEMQKLSLFIQNDGKNVFEKMKQANRQAFPQYEQEIKGISQGAEIPMDSIWMVNLIPELESIMTVTYKEKKQKKRQGGKQKQTDEEENEEHCSDFYAVSPNGYHEGFSHGHNEDWSHDVKDLWYIVKYSANKHLESDFKSCAGMAYPGTIIGWAATWNEDGIYLTQNSLFPQRKLQKDSKDFGTGLSSAFIQREAICGHSVLPRKYSMDATIEGLTASYLWNYGASINVVDMKNRRMANIETFRNEFAIFEITEKQGNYSHFNMYKNLKPGVLDAPSASSIHRQRRSDSLPSIHSSEDIRNHLSDTYDKEYPIFRDITLATFILDGITRKLQVWAGTKSSGDQLPIYSWDLNTFFD